MNINNIQIMINKIIKATKNKVFLNKIKKVKVVINKVILKVNFNKMIKYSSWMNKQQKIYSF